MSSLQGCKKIVTLFFCSQKIQQAVISLIDAFVTTANLGVLSASQHAKAEQVIQQPEVWLYYVW